MGFFDKIFGPKETTPSIAPEPSGIDFYSALSLHISGEFEPALDAYQSIEAELPDYTLAPFFAAAALAYTGRVPEAAEKLRDLSLTVASAGEALSRVVATELFTLFSNEPTLKVPVVAEIIVDFGDRLKQEGFIQESAVCYEIGVGMLPEHAPVLHRLGDTLHDLQIYDYAEAVLKKALEFAPNHWDSLYTYAVLLQDLGRFDEAIGCYEKAMPMNPDHVKCRNNYGAALMLTGRLDEALEQCTQAAGLDPEFTLAKVNLGNIHLMRQEYEAARTCFSEALALNPDLAPALFGLGAVEQNTGGNPTRIRELYLKASELSPDNPQFREALASLPAE